MKTFDSYWVTDIWLFVRFNCLLFVQWDLQQLTEKKELIMAFIGFSHSLETPVSICSNTFRSVCLNASGFRGEYCYWHTNNIIMRCSMYKFSPIKKYEEWGMTFLKHQQVLKDARR